MAPGACCSAGECRVIVDQATCESIFAGTFFEGFDCDVVDCDEGVVLGACCLPDDSCALTSRLGQDITNPSCLARGGDFQGEGTLCIGEDGVGICDPPPTLEGCIEARPDRASGRGWSPNLCQNAVLLPEVPDREDADPTAGEWSLSTPHPVRALPGPPTDDPCAHHRADLVVDDDGFASAAFCSQPNFGDPDTRQWSLSDLFVVESDPNGFVSPGDAYFAGAYHAPLFTEAHLRSHKMRCGGVI